MSKNSKFLPFPNQYSRNNDHKNKTICLLLAGTTDVYVFICYFQTSYSLNMCSFKISNNTSIFISIVIIHKL